MARSEQGRDSAMNGRHADDFNPTPSVIEVGAGAHRRFENSKRVPVRANVPSRNWEYDPPSPPEFLPRTPAAFTEAVVAPSAPLPDIDVEEDDATVEIHGDIREREVLEDCRDAVRDSEMQAAAVAFQRPEPADCRQPTRRRRHRNQWCREVFLLCVPLLLLIIILVVLISLLWWSVGQFLRDIPPR